MAVSQTATRMGMYKSYIVLYIWSDIYGPYGIHTGSLTYDVYMQYIAIKQV